MARKAKKEGADPSPFVTVKVRRVRHTKLVFIASAQGRDIADILDELIKEPLDALYRREQAKMEGGD